MSEDRARPRGHRRGTTPLAQTTRHRNGRVVRSACIHSVQSSKQLVEAELGNTSAKILLHPIPVRSAIPHQASQQLTRSGHFYRLSPSRDREGLGLWKGSRHRVRGADERRLCFSSTRASPGQWRNGQPFAALERLRSRSCGTGGIYSIPKPGRSTSPPREACRSTLVIPVRGHVSSGFGPRLSRPSSQAPDGSCFCWAILRRTAAWSAVLLRS